MFTFKIHIYLVDTSTGPLFYESSHLKWTGSDFNGDVIVFMIKVQNSGKLDESKMHQKDKNKY